MTSETQPPPPLMLIKGNATPEEVAVVVAVLQAASTAPAPAAVRPRSSWANPARSVRTTLRPGPGAWRVSALPR
ncbi:MAG: acyl-CoA carboxylase epsilon subunit [Nocardioidaceae bacterium]